MVWTQGSTPADDRGEASSFLTFGIPETDAVQLTQAVEHEVDADGSATLPLHPYRGAQLAQMGAGACTELFVFQCWITGVGNVDCPEYLQVTIDPAP